MKLPDVPYDAREVLAHGNVFTVHRREAAFEQTVLIAIPRNGPRSDADTDLEDLLVRRATEALDLGTHTQDFTFHVEQQVRVLDA